MTRLTEAELAAKSARNRKAKAETFSELRKTTDGAMKEIQAAIGPMMIPGASSDTVGSKFDEEKIKYFWIGAAEKYKKSSKDLMKIIDGLYDPPKNTDLVAHVSKTGKVGKFKPIIPTEHQEQCAVIAWCDQHPIARHIFAIPNGAHKSPATAAKFKREGLRKGVPDLFLPVASKGYYGLFIEMKRLKGSVVSDEQSIWADLLWRKGYLVAMCRGADEAIAVIQNYIKET